jgi:hypothetical protein
MVNHVVLYTLSNGTHFILVFSIEDVPFAIFVHVQYNALQWWASYL